MELLGGSITVESEFGKGSIFCVSFFDVEIGAHSNLTISSMDNSYLKTIRFKNPTIMLVEDTLYNRQVIKGYLEAVNITIIESDNGEDCITTVRKYSPDIILMHMQMPVQDSFITINILKTDNEFKNIPIIAFTASGMKHEKVLKENPSMQITIIMEQLTDYLNSFNIERIAATLKQLTIF